MSNAADEQAKAQMSSIAAMVAALECDYYRLEELKEKKEEAEENNDTLSTSELQELAALQEAAGDCESMDDAQDRIQEDPLSVEVRSGWFTPGCSDDAMLEEFQILLCTGGPAVRILGRLNAHGEPSHAWLEYQDWGTPWTEYRGGNGDQQALLTYCQQFYFGE